VADAKEKVLLDTDIGNDIDDAVALAYLLSQERCDLVGITTVSGEPEKRAELASAICYNAGRPQIRVHCGSPGAMLIEMRQKEARQAAALGQWERQRSFARCTALEFMRDTIRASPGEITLLAIGPMTNVGLLFACDPEIPALLKRVVLMCGRFLYEKADRWNAFLKGGEWNAMLDPHATAITYGNTFHSRPPEHFSYGLDVTRQCTMPAQQCRERFTAKVLQPVRDFAEVFFAGNDHITFHDPLAAAAIFEPDLCSYRRGKVLVSLNEPTMGWTVFKEGAEDSPHTVAAEVDPQRFFDHYFSVVR
jgi:inosine-uridine nucleoside N-ribohydrolase